MNQTPQSVISFFYYMWNRWNILECEEAFRNSSCGWEHLWGKWSACCKDNGTHGAISVFFSYLDSENQHLLASRAIKLYNGKQRIK